jgi:hypothetical protein
MKQTAVEWLQQALEDTILTHEQIMQTVGLFEQAKEMEQEQMLKTFAESRVISFECAVWNCEGDRKKWESFEEYYNETFNTNEK